jgi:hypothetical protein
MVILLVLDNGEQMARIADSFMVMQYHFAYGLKVI